MQWPQAEGDPDILQWVNDASTPWDISHQYRGKNIDKQNNLGQSLWNVMNKQEQFQELPYSIILFISHSQNEKKN